MEERRRSDAAAFLPVLTLLVDAPDDARAVVMVTATEAQIMAFSRCLFRRIGTFQISGNVEILASVGGVITLL